MSWTYLNELVPTSRDDHGVRGVGAEADAAHPLSVALLGDVELAVTKSVPQLDGPVTGTRNDLTVVRAEANAQHVTSVTNEAAGGLASVQVPQTQRLVPRGREGELAVRRNHNIGHEVVVAVQDLLGVAVVSLVTRKLPDNDGVVARGSEQQVRVLLRSSNGSDPTLVAGQASLVSERLRPSILLVCVLASKSRMQDTHMSINVRGSKQLNWWYKQSVVRRNSALPTPLVAALALELEPFARAAACAKLYFFWARRRYSTCWI